jgi:hypothetical protein
MLKYEKMNGEMRVGYLPVSSVWFEEPYNRCFTQIGLYAMDHAFRIDTLGLKTWTVPFPLGLSTKRPDDLENGLRWAGNSEETIRIIMHGLRDRDPGPWLEFFCVFHDEVTETPAKRVRREEQT